MEECNYGMLIGQKEPFDVVQYEDYRFDFIRKSDELKEVSICPKDDYLTCKTLDDKDMLIYVHDEFKGDAPEHSRHLQEPCRDTQKRQRYPVQQRRQRDVRNCVAGHTRSENRQDRGGQCRA